MTNKIDKTFIILQQITISALTYKEVSHWI